MIMAILIFGATALLIGYAVERLAAYLAPTDDSLVSKVNALLPQTQCAQCGYPGCRPYAQAIVEKNAPIDQCPPGGQTTTVALSRLLGRETPNRQPIAEAAALVARIREADCIGCTLCIKACPVDAIVGAHEYMHSVIGQYCTGCELCVAPCPMDCIEMIEAKPDKNTDRPAKVETACIHCDRCNDICPVDLPAHSLYQLIRACNMDDAISEGLADCILCGSCDVVCPSHIPLTQIYRNAKHQYHKLSKQRRHAAQAQSRYEIHNTRLLQQELKDRQSQQTQKELLKAQIKSQQTPR